jgi:hypothetical protein
LEKTTVSLWNSRRPKHRHPLDTTLLLADLLERFAHQVRAVGEEFLLMRMWPVPPEADLLHARLLAAAVDRLDQAIQMLKADLLRSESRTAGKP